MTPLAERFRIGHHAGSPNEDVYFVVVGISTAHTAVLRALRNYLRQACWEWQGQSVFHGESLDSSSAGDCTFMMLFRWAKEAAGVLRAHGLGLLAAEARGGHHDGTREALLTSIGALDAFAEACRAAAPVW